MINNTGYNYGIYSNPYSTTGTSTSFSSTPYSLTSPTEQYDQVVLTKKSEKENKTAKTIGIIGGIAAIGVTALALYKGKGVDGNVFKKIGAGFKQIGDDIGKLFKHADDVNTTGTKKGAALTDTANNTAAKKGAVQSSETCQQEALERLNHKKEIEHAREVQDGLFQAKHGGSGKSAKESAEVFMQNTPEALVENFEKQQKQTLTELNEQYSQMEKYKKASEQLDAKWRSYGDQIAQAKTTRENNIKQLEKPIADIKKQLETTTDPKEIERLQNNLSKLEEMCSEDTIKKLEAEELAVLKQHNKAYEKYTTAQTKFEQLDAKWRSGEVKAEQYENAFAQITEQIEQAKKDGVDAETIQKMQDNLAAMPKMFFK